MKSCSFFFYNYQELNPGELKGGLHGGAGILSRINNSLIFSLSSQLIIPYSQLTVLKILTLMHAQCMSSTGPLLEGLFHCTEFFFLTQNGTLVIKFDQLKFAILLYMT